MGPTCKAAPGGSCLRREEWPSFLSFFLWLWPQHVEVPVPGIEPAHSRNLNCCRDITKRMPRLSACSSFGLNALPQALHYSKFYLPDLQGWPKLNSKISLKLFPPVLCPFRLLSSTSRMPFQLQCVGVPWRDCQPLVPTPGTPNQWDHGRAPNLPF